MSQLEVPQISVQRYVELLKRRRWQVIPASLLGLLIGGLVAFFIPRYYVADAMLQHRRVPGQPDSSNREDPFRSIVDSAKALIPLTVRSAMQKLRWPEIAVGSPFERTQKEREVQSRLSVLDKNQVQAKDREVAQIVVQFRDRDGLRASNFVNMLVDTWIEDATTAMRVPVMKRRTQHTDDANRYRAQWDRLRLELQELEMLYGIDPTFDIGLQRRQLPEQDAEQKVQRALLEQKTKLREAVKKQLEVDRETLARMNRRIKPDGSELLEAAKGKPEGKALVNSIKYFRMQLMITWQQGTRERVRAQRAIELYEAMLRDLVDVSEADEDGLVANPAYQALVDKIEKQEKEIAGLDKEIAPAQTLADAAAKRLADLPAAYTNYQSKLVDLGQANARRMQADKDLAADDNTLAQIENEKTIEFVQRADPPPRPTEPNIFLVALIGCALGLAIAIGLILLLDMLQGSFKTIDDVERGLPVPVLGGVSHLETEAEREHTVRSRRRVSLAAAAFVGLCVIVIAIFYIDPTRLPSFVRDLLVMLLGA
ncbi:MAG: hypothetical protein ABIP94_00565 [Planctomycetota bacterium]